MAGNLNEAMSQSTADFQKHILPIYQKLYSNCRLYPTENVNEKIASILDTRAGIDVLLDDSKVVKGLASRVQRAFKNWRTFTVRCERESGTDTEYKKRARAFNQNGLYPALTSQAYISPDNNKILGMAIIPTQELWDYIEKENPPVKKNS